MAWYNPLTWFTTYDPATAKASDVLAEVDVIEDGKAESVEAMKDAVDAGDKYLFEIQTLSKTGEVIHILPAGEDHTPWGAADRVAPFEMVKALLTLEEAARLKNLSKAAGGDGNAKTSAQIEAEKTPETPVDPAPESLFRATALDKARPDVIVAAKPLVVEEEKEP